MKREPLTTFHIGLHVHDIKKTIEFYSKFLGMATTKVKPDYLKFEVENPALALTFNQSTSEVFPHFGHMGFRLGSKDLLVETRSRIAVSGIKLTDELDTNCCYANQDKFWVTDPDGYQWEVYVLNHDVEADTAIEESTCCQPESACC